MITRKCIALIVWIYHLLHSPYTRVTRRSTVEGYFLTKDLALMKLALTSDAHAFYEYSETQRNLIFATNKNKTQRDCLKMNASRYVAEEVLKSVSSYDHWPKYYQILPLISVKTVQSVCLQRCRQLLRADSSVYCSKAMLHCITGEIFSLNAEWRKILQSILSQNRLHRLVCEQLDLVCSK